MALGSHLITVRRLEKYINDVIGKKANLPDTSKTIIGNISQINSDLTQEVSRATSQDNVLSARIDRIASLPSGSTSGDAELIDIRVGADGVTYTSAGNAVRSQASSLKSSLSAEKNNINELLYFDKVKIPLTWQDGYVMSDGTITASNEWQYATLNVDNLLLTLDIVGFSWYNVKSYLFVDAIGNKYYPTESYTTQTQKTYTDVQFNKTGTLYINRYNSNTSAGAKTNIPTGVKQVSELNNVVVDIINKGYENRAFVFNDEPLTPVETLTSYMLNETTGLPESFTNPDYIVKKYSVNPYVTYRIVGNAWYYHGIITICDSDGEVIYKFASPTSTTFTDYDEQITMPYNASYIYVAYASDHNVGGAFLRELAGGTLAKKKWIAIGDSLTSKSTLGASVDNYVDYVADRLNLVAINKGVGGTGYGNDGGSSQAFYQRVPDFTETNPDIITVFGSFNDLGIGKGIGNRTDDTDATLSGCMNLTFDAIYSKYPKAVLGVIAPTPWQTSYNQAGFLEYVNAIKSICEMRNIPFLDLYHNSNLYPWDATFRHNFYKDDNDGAHPNTDGHKRIASQVIKFIEQIYM